MSDERDNPFYDLGYTRPDVAVVLRKKRLARQSMESARVGMGEKVPRRSGHVRDYESDRDHPEIEALPADHVTDEPDQLMIPGINQAIIRAELEALTRKRIETRHGIGTSATRAAFRVHNQK